MSPSVVRVRRHRQRVRNGLVCLTVEVAELPLTERLVEVGLLRADDADNRAQLCRAVERAVRLWAETS